MADSERDGAPPRHVRVVDQLRPLESKSAGRVAVGPVTLVVAECITVTSAMRKHARWQHSSVSAILGGNSSKPPPHPVNWKKSRSRPAVPDEDEALPSRWGLRGKKGKSMEDNPLMAAFTRLRSDLKSCKDLATFDTPALLLPFLLIIRSSATSAPITSLAVIAVSKFLAYNVLSADSPRFALAMQLLSSAITHCRFEASADPADEVVLLRILKLMEIMISGSAGDVLGDESVCEMMETGISMCCQARLSEVLRRSAEISMVHMCQVIFGKLKDATLAFEDGILSPITVADEMGFVKMDPSVNGGEQKHFGANLDSAASVKTEDAMGPSEEASPMASNGDVVEPTTSEGTEADVDVDIKPYSLPSIQELFRVLVELLDPHEKQHTDTMRIMALRIVDVALEVAGGSISQYPTIASLAKDTLCKNLFQLVRSENMAILNESLRVTGTLLSTCRPFLKLQQELFLAYLIACLHPRVDIPHEPGIDPQLYEGVPQAPRLVKPAPSQSASGRSTPVPVRDRQKLGLEGGARKPDAREAMVESLGALVRIPEFMAELFVNYDCDIDRADLCVDVIGLLARNAFPDSATWSTTNVAPLCLDALLSTVQFMSERIAPNANGAQAPKIKNLREQRALKKIIIRGVAKFNESPKGGIAYLAAQNVIRDPNDPKSIAKFLKGTTRIDKRVLGDFLSKRDNLPILTAFLDAFDFTGLRVDEALRQLLTSFRLPGESQLIERIVTEFSTKYCAHATPEGIADKDAVFILTYAIIMLNTDQHNPNMKAQNRMSFIDFTRNLRGVNGGKDFAEEYLKGIYDSIRMREILLPEEHDNKHAYDHAWTDLTIKAQSATDLITYDTDAYDADMFLATWKPIIAVLSYVFMSATDDTVFSRVVTGFHQCASIAAAYGLHEAIDRIVFCLSHMSSLDQTVPPNTSLNTEVQVGEKSIMVSETAVRFGKDFKAQLATVVLFGLVNGNEAAIRDGWAHIVRMMLYLFVNSLFHPRMPGTPKQIFDHPTPVQPPSQVIDRANLSESGIFSAFTSYVSSFASDEPPEPSDSEIESSLCTIDCIGACPLDEILNNITTVPVAAAQSIVRALLDMLPEESAPRVISVRSDLPAPSAVRPPLSKARVASPRYDPSLLFVLEIATTLAMRDAESTEALAKEVADALQGVIRDTNNVHPIVISRVAYCLLNLLRASHDHDFLRAPVLLHSFSAFDRPVQVQSAPYLLSGIQECVGGSIGLRREIANSPDFWSILRSLQSIPEICPSVFSILEELVESKPSPIVADNYEAFVAILNEFATAGSIGAAAEQQHDQAMRKQKGLKPKPRSAEAVVRGTKAVSLIYRMTGRVPQFIAKSQLQTNEAWNTYWSPIFRALTNQSINPCREIRQQALNLLQRALVSADLASSDHVEWTAIFTEVLFPLINQLLKPDVYQFDPAGMADTRVQATALLCKIFLHYLVLLSEWDGMSTLWIQILTIMGRLLNSGQGDNLDDAVSENLKNILLVMSSSGYMVPPSKDPAKEELWTQTWDRVNKFLPGLYAELYPEEVKRSRVVQIE